MTTVSLGANSKIAALPSERERIQQFYRDVLGCKVDTKPEADLIWLRPDFYLGVVYEDPPASESQLLMAIWLELRVERPEELKEKILSFGVTTIEYPRDEDHFYFQAPGGQVFRLVSNTEDMNLYRPHGSALHPRSQRRAAQDRPEAEAVESFASGLARNGGYVAF
jgi:Glyoxalase-like domain